MNKSNLTRIALHRAAHVRIWRLLQQKKNIEAAQLMQPPSEPVQPKPEPDVFTLPLPWGE